MEPKIRLARTPRYRGRSLITLVLLIGVLINGTNGTQANEASTEALIIEGTINDDRGLDKLLEKDTVEKMLEAQKDRGEDGNVLGEKEYIVGVDGVEEVKAKAENEELPADIKANGNKNGGKNQDILPGSAKQDELQADAEKLNEDGLRIAEEIVISKNQTVSKLSDKIRKIIEHYQQEDPVGMPDSGIPDPLLVPDVEKSSMVFEDMKVHGLAEFRIVKMHTDAPAMEFTLEIIFKKLEIKGNYTLTQWWSQSKGIFVVSLLDVTMEGKATLIVNRAGKLEAERINTNARVGSIKLDFQNLGLMGTLVQNIMNTAGPFLFDSLKPQLLSEMNVKLLQMTNENLKSLKHQFEPSAGLPIDNLIQTARTAVREQRFDPYNMPIPYPSNNSFLKVEELVLHGLSNFYRIGDVSLHMENKVLQLSLHVGIPLLKGRISWRMLFSYRSTTCFTFKYLQLHISLNQTINDLSKSPVLDKVRVKIGSIKLSKRQSESMLDNIFKNYVYDHLPNVLREGILNLMQQPLQVAIQNSLDQVKLNDYLSQL